MTIALELHPANQLTLSAPLVRPPVHRRTTAWAKLLFWHTHAYTTIFWIMVLTGLSMLLLWGYEAVKQILHATNTTKRLK